MSSRCAPSRRHRMTAMTMEALLTLTIHLIQTTRSEVSQINLVGLQTLTEGFEFHP